MFLCELLTGHYTSQLGDGEMCLCGEGLKTEQL